MNKTKKNILVVIGVIVTAWLLLEYISYERALERQYKTEQREVERRHEILLEAIHSR